MENGETRTSQMGACSGRFGRGIVRESERTEKMSENILVDRQKDTEKGQERR